MVSAVLVLVGCGGGPATPPTYRVCELPVVPRVLRALQEEPAGRVVELLVAEPSSVRPEPSLGNVEVTPGWVLRGAILFSPPLAGAVVRTEVRAIGATGTLTVERAPPPSVDPRPRTLSANLTLQFGPNDVGPPSRPWVAGPLEVGPCD